jgi:hypothetical protein
MHSRLSRRLRHLAALIVPLGATMGVLAGTTGVLASATGLPLGTGTACGCEAEKPEAQNILIKPIESGEGAVKSNTGKCPEIMIGGAPKVNFKKLTEWCEYEVVNENNGPKKEEVTVEAEAFVYLAKCNAVGGCLGFKAPAKAPECNVGVKLKAKKMCYDTVEYVRKPAAQEETAYRVETQSEKGAVAKTVANQIVE